ncbi:hypothetical protein ACQPZP_06115 [Spirillospora sp. CA-142024]|uniref:hypothetical protein n=1 Tax=Spirillospora sp. CA-142024 TaxID=3240036 RepID=UPI003D8FA311
MSEIPDRRQLHFRLGGNAHHVAGLLDEAMPYFEAPRLADKIKPVVKCLLTWADQGIFDLRVYRVDRGAGCWATQIEFGWAGELSEAQRARLDRFYDEAVESPDQYMVNWHEYGLGGRLTSAWEADDGYPVVAPDVEAGRVVAIIFDDLA